MWVEARGGETRDNLAPHSNYQYEKTLRYSLLL